MDKATLLLSDGTRYIGKAFGARTEASGIMAFDTGVIGCIERLTDPVVSGRLVAFTFPDIGGHGVIPKDFYSDRVCAAGVVTRGWAEHPSNWQAKGNLDSLLQEQGIPGIYGIDTRALMIRLRNSSDLTGALLQGERDVGSFDFASVQPSAPAETAHRSIFPANSGPRVAVVDYGCGQALANRLAALGACVTLLSTGQIPEQPVDAVALSDGPEDGDFAIPAGLPQGLPYYGEGYGHLALAKMRGGSVSRMRAQHGGSNLPVKWGERVYITAQLHAWAVSGMPEGVKEAIANLNDRTVEALVYGDAISVQFPPCMEKGPHDMSFVYGRFLAMIKA